MKKLVLILFVSLTLVKGEFSMAQADLESVPSTWTASKGTLSADTNHYRLGTKSVAWNWVANDTLKVSGLKFIYNTVQITSDNTLDIGLHNASLSPADSVIFQFFDKKKRLRYYFSVHLNYKGWYEVIRNYKTNMYKPKNAAATNDSIECVKQTVSR